MPQSQLEKDHHQMDFIFEHLEVVLTNSAETLSTTLSFEVIFHLHASLKHRFSEFFLGAFHHSKIKKLDHSHQKAIEQLTTQLLHLKKSFSFNLDHCKIKTKIHEFYKEIKLDNKNQAAAEMIRNIKLLFIRIKQITELLADFYQEQLKMICKSQEILVMAAQIKPIEQFTNTILLTTNHFIFYKKYLDCKKEQSNDFIIQLTVGINEFLAKKTSSDLKVNASFLFCTILSDFFWKVFHEFCDLRTFKKKLAEHAIALTALLKSLNFIYNVYNTQGKKDIESKFSFLKQFLSVRQPNVESFLPSAILSEEIANEDFKYFIFICKQMELLQKPISKRIPPPPPKKEQLLYLPVSGSGSEEVTVVVPQILATDFLNLITITEGVVNKKRTGVAITIPNYLLHNELIHILYTCAKQPIQLDVKTASSIAEQKILALFLWCYFSKNNKTFIYDHVSKNKVHSLVVHSPNETFSVNFILQSSITAAMQNDQLYFFNESLAIDSGEHGSIHFADEIMHITPKMSSGLDDIALHVTGNAGCAIKKLRKTNFTKNLSYHFSQLENEYAAMSYEQLFADFRNQFILDNDESELRKDIIRATIVKRLCKNSLSIEKDNLSNFHGNSNRIFMKKFSGKKLLSLLNHTPFLSDESKFDLILILLKELYRYLRSGNVISHFDVAARNYIVETTNDGSFKIVAAHLIDSDMNILKEIIDKNLLDDFLELYLGNNMAIYSYDAIQIGTKLDIDHEMGSEDLIAFARMIVHCLNPGSEQIKTKKGYASMFNFYKYQISNMDFFKRYPDLQKLFNERIHVEDRSKRMKIGDAIQEIEKIKTNIFGNQNVVTNLALLQK